MTKTGNKKEGKEKYHSYTKTNNKTRGTNQEHTRTEETGTIAQNKRVDKNR